MVVQFVNHVGPAAPSGSPAQRPVVTDAEAECIAVDLIDATVPIGLVRSGLV
jgi:hypothetical protein